MGFLSRLFGPGAPKAMPVHVDDANFVDEVRRSELPVVLDVWSPGCGPCKNMEPIVMSLAGRYQGRVKVAELNAAESQATAARLGVSGTPTVLFFKGHHEVDRVVGFVGERYLADVVDHELLGGADVQS
jgi:thioredoxin